SRVKAAREAPKLGVQFADRFLEFGTTTIEAKSGYGLNLTTGIRMLESMRPVYRLEVIPTYLGAHAVPAEFRDNRAAFVDQVIEDMRTIGARRLAEFCDVFVEPGVFTPDEARRIFAAARSLGMGIKI